MNAALAEIKKGNHPLMMDYIEFSFDERLLGPGRVLREESISPTHYSPSKVRYNDAGEKEHDGWICTQAFYAYPVWEDFRVHYMRMVRCGKQDYLNYTQLTYDMTSTLNDIEWYCSLCDNEFRGSGFKCSSKICKFQTGAEVCSSCYANNKTCGTCHSALHPI